MARVHAVIRSGRAARQRRTLHRFGRGGAAGLGAHRRSLDRGDQGRRRQHTAPHHPQHRDRRRRAALRAAAARSRGGGLRHQRHPVGRVRQARCAAGARWWCWAADRLAASWRKAFARLGSQVTQVEMAPRIMMREDEEVSALARQSLTRDGVDVLTGHKALRCEREERDGRHAQIPRGRARRRGAAHRVRRLGLRGGPRRRGCRAMGWKIWVSRPSARW